MYIWKKIFKKNPSFSFSPRGQALEQGPAGHTVHITLCFAVVCFKQQSCPAWLRSAWDGLDHCFPPWAGERWELGKSWRSLCMKRREAAPQPPGGFGVTWPRLVMLGLLPPPRGWVSVVMPGRWVSKVGPNHSGGPAFHWESGVGRASVLPLPSAQIGFALHRHKSAFALKKVQCISPATLLAWISVYNFTPLNRQQGKKNKINHFVHLMASLDRQ